MKTPRTLILILCFALSACATIKISPQNRAAIHSARMVNPPNGAEPNTYIDQTSQAAFRVGSMGGFVGAIICGGIAGYDIQCGLKRWAPVTAGRQPRVLQLFREGVEQEFAREGKLRIAANGPGDAQLVFKRISYGVEHCGHQRFCVVVTAAVEMRKTDEEVVWRTYASTKSPSRLTLDQYRQDPLAYSAALEAGVQSLAKKLVEAY